MLHARLLPSSPGCRPGAPPWRIGLAARLAAVALAGGLSLPHASAAPAAGPGASADASSRTLRWGDGVRLELFPLHQSSGEPAARSRFDLLIPPGTLTPGFSALQINLPSPLRDGASLARRLSLCRLASPASERHLHCLEPWPIVVEPLPAGLRIRPQRPLESGVPYAFSVKTRNPLGEGFLPVRLFGIRPDPQEPVYLGTWLIEILSRAE
jgi:hypothetical protein